jgi:hypothetical protein
VASGVDHGLGHSRRFGALPSTSVHPQVRTSNQSLDCSATYPWKQKATTATSEAARMGAVPNRRRSRIPVCWRALGCGVMVPRRSNIAHLRRPWRATLRQSTPTGTRVRVGLNYKFGSIGAIVTK